MSLAVVPGDTPDTIRTKRLFTTAMWASLVTSAGSILLMVQNDAPWAALTVSIPLVTAALSLVAMWREPSTYPAVMHLVAAGTIFTSGVLAVMFGGIFESAGAVYWSMLAVLGAVAIFSDRRAHYWLAVFGLVTALVIVLEARIEPLYEIPNPDFLALFNVVVVSLFIYIILYYFVRKTDTLLHQADRLLRNVLPDEVAERLKTSDEMIADEFESASILFADVADFTPMASKMEPGEVVGLLNDIFTVFDDLVAVRGLEKIKTIGDAYMVAAGVPVPREDHARAMCDLALTMQAHLESYTYAGRHLNMRIGIASGPVMAGIIGRQKFSYDLWGDTVNLASRMETTGIPGRIQLSAGTRDLVAPWFVCERRGFVDVKGKGPVETWYLVGPAVREAVTQRDRR